MFSNQLQNDVDRMSVAVGADPPVKKTTWTTMDNQNLVVIDYPEKVVLVVHVVFFSLCTPTKGCWFAAVRAGTGPAPTTSQFSVLCKQNKQVRALTSQFSLLTSQF